MSDTFRGTSFESEKEWKNQFNLIILIIMQNNYSLRLFFKHNDFQMLVVTASIPFVLKFKFLTTHWSISKYIWRMTRPWTLGKVWRCDVTSWSIFICPKRETNFSRSKVIISQAVWQLALNVFETMGFNFRHQMVRNHGTLTVAKYCYIIASNMDVLFIHAPIKSEMGLIVNNFYSIAVDIL